MKNKSFISSFFRYFLVVVCFLAISSNLYSFYFGPKLKESSKVAKEQTANEEDEKSSEQRYCAYEAVVPVIHFNKVFHFCSILKVEVAERTVVLVKHTPPALFTRPFYKTLFRMIISPNAP